MKYWSFTSPTLALLPQTACQDSKGQLVLVTPNETSRCSTCLTSCLRFILGAVLVSLIFGAGYQVGNNAPSNKKHIDLSAVRCFIPIGGGKVPPGGALPQEQFTDEFCIKARHRYFNKGQYDKQTTAAYATGGFLLEQETDYTKMVVFDIDETVLSNVPFYGKYGYRRVTGDIKTQWQNSSAGPAIPAALDYYKELREKGYSVSFITGRHEPVRAATVKNLENEGFGPQCTKNPAPIGEICYHELILRTEDDHRDATIYKSEARKSLEDQGFTLVAGIGDQWSDLFGTSRPPVILKIPNPMYYIF
eukprot:g6030.t1